MDSTASSVSPSDSAEATKQRAIRPIRAMLARGAACDLCRSRKVKCDGGKPICAQCLKSAKGNAEACSCVYEGAGTVAKGAPAQPKKRPSGAARTSSDGSSSLEKRAREAEGENEEDGGVKKKQGTGGVRVETLVDRISELERRLRIQAESVPLRGSTTSSYPSSSQPALTFAPNGSSAYSAPTSSYPPLSYPSEVPVSLGFAEFTSGTISDSPAGTGAFVGGSSYPPLNYGVNASASSAMASGFNGFSVPSPIDLQQTLQTGAISQSPIDFGAGDALSNPPSGPLHPTTNGFYSSSSSGGGNGSLAASPDDALGLDAAFLQILYPSWPTSLPSPSIVHRLVHLFFARCTIPATIFNRARFLASLDLPPTAAGFPETALLHAMCSYAAVLVSEEALYQDGMVKKYWEGYKGPREYHYACARADVDKGVLSSSRNTFQILQATILCCYIAYQAASFTELWLLSGLATRLCTPLGLNHLPPYNYLQGVAGDPYPDWSNRIRMTPAAVTHSILPPARDQEEYFEHAVTFWTAFCIDRHASASTDWSTSIDELDISTHLPFYTTNPTPELSIDPIQGRIHSLSPKDPNFLHETSAKIGSLGLYIKGNVLLGRVINWLQRLPRGQVVPAGETCSTMKITIKASDAGNMLDGYLASSHAIPHVATILLHEPFVDRHDQSPKSSLAKCLTSAKIVVQSTAVLYGSSNDLAGVDPFIPFTWSVVGRSLVRDYAIRRLWGDVAGAAASRELAEHVLMFMASCSKSGLGISVALTKSLRDMLNDPNRVLPMDGTEEGYCKEDPINRPILEEVPIVPRD